MKQIACGLGSKRYTSGRKSSNGIVTFRGNIPLKKHTIFPRGVSPPFGCYIFSHNTHFSTCCLIKQNEETKLEHAETVVDENKRMIVRRILI